MPNLEIRRGGQMNQNKRTKRLIVIKIIAGP
jgi:hypothetical protein